MKRINRRLLAVVASSALALPMAAQVQADEMEVPEHSHPVMHAARARHRRRDGARCMHTRPRSTRTPSSPSCTGTVRPVYGQLVFGVKMSDDDKPGSNSAWNLSDGGTNKFGIKGSVAAGAGLTAGFHFERSANAGFGARYHNVSLAGAFGTFTLGQQDAPYHGATSWDGSNALGGLTNGDVIGGASRISGVSYASNLGGPFSFSVLLGSGLHGTDATSDGANHISAGASLAAGPVKLSVGYRDDDDGVDAAGAAVVGSTRIGGTVGGSVAGIGWEVGADSGEDSLRHRLRR